MDQHDGMDQKQEQQRRFERVPLDIAVEISGRTRAGEPFSSRGSMSNISDGGLGCVTADSDSFRVGQKIVVRMRLPGMDASTFAFTSTACVVWVRRNDVGAELGIAVDEPIAVKQHLGGSISALH